MSFCFSCITTALFTSLFFRYTLITRATATTTTTTTTSTAANLSNLGRIGQSNNNSKWRQEFREAFGQNHQYLCASLAIAALVVAYLAC